MTIPCGKIDCVGCGACRPVCPNGALSMEKDDAGFLYPSINKEKCVDCGRCRGVCPIRNLNRTSVSPPFEPEVYACWNQNRPVRIQSSSGGMFSVLAESILAEGGVVYGAVFDETMKVILKRGERSDALDRMRGSKYVQAESGDVFQEAADDLSQGRPVLFSGAPCQIAALYAFLRSQKKPQDDPSADGESAGPENLVTLDFICHGVASPALWASFVRALEEKYDDKLVAVHFRDKASGWKSPTLRCRFRRRKDLLVPWSALGVTLENAFIRFYHKNLSLRASCLRCPFTQLPRMGDITLADFQALYHNRSFARETRDGISLNLVNSRRGKALFDRCAPFMTAIQRNLAETGLLKGTPAEADPRREEFLRDAAKMAYRPLVQKYAPVIRPPFRFGTALNSILRRILGRTAALRLREWLEKGRIPR